MGEMTNPRGTTSVVGMAATFPGAPDLDRLWSVLVNGVPQTSQAPTLRAESAGPRFGGFAPLIMDRESLPAPSVLRVAEPWHVIAVDVARRAVRDAGLDEQLRRSCAVLVGTSTLLGRPQQAWAHGHQMDSDLVTSIHPNLLAGRIASELDLHGPQQVVDAACSSAVAALETGRLMLAAGTVDAVLVGAVGPWLDRGIQESFAAVDMLADDECRPFMADAVGTVIGEGVGFLVLKRTADVRAGESYADIRAVGQSSDGRSLGLLTSRPEGLASAIERAWRAGGLGPDDIAAVEAHAIGTELGDRSEWRTLERLRGEEPWLVGSVKGLLGHALAAGGMGGLMKAILSVHYGVITPSVGTGPRRRIEMSSEQVAATTLTPVPLRSGVRRMGVNTVAFGGANSHVVVQEPQRESRPAPAHWPVEVLLFGGSDLESLRQSLSAARGDLLDGGQLSALASKRPALNSVHRAGLVATSADEAVARIDRIIAAIENGKDRLRSPDGTILGVPVEDPRVGFLCPGEGSQRPGMFQDLAACLPSVEDWFVELDSTLLARDVQPMTSKMWSQPLAPTDPSELSGVFGGTQSLAVASVASADTLARLGVAPSAVLGQSSGEFAAGVISGAVSGMRTDELMPAIARVTEVQVAAAQRFPLPPGATFAINGRTVDDVRGVVEQTPTAVITNVNAPSVCVVWVADAHREEFLAAVRAPGTVIGELPFTLAYHTEAFTPRAEMMREAYQDIDVRRAQLPWYSCSTTERVDADADSIRDLLAEQWWKPVDFAATITRMVEEQALTCLVEVGPGTMLGACSTDVLRGTGVLVLSMDSAAGTLATSLRTLAALWVHGMDVDVTWLHRIRGALGDRIEDPVDLLELEPSIGEPIARRASAGDHAHALETHLTLMRQFVQAQETVMGSAAVRAIVGEELFDEGRSDREWILGECVERTNDSSTHIKVFRSDTDPAVAHHAIGGVVSQRDSSLTPLAVVPFTASMEMVAQAARDLVGDHLVCTQVRNMRAHRWVALDAGEATVRIEARQSGEDLVDVQVVVIRDPHIAPADPADAGPEYVAFEAQVVLSDRYLPAPAGPSDEWSEGPARGLYSGLFHGPAFRGVEVVDDVTEDRVRARGRRRRVDLHPDYPLRPRMEMDPFLADTCGQLVSFWANEHNSQTVGAFPYSAEAYEVYGPLIPEGTPVRFEVRIRESDDVGTCADIDIIDGSGSVLARFVGLRQRVFAFPTRFLTYLLNPAREMLSVDWPVGPPPVTLRAITDMQPDFLVSGYGIWSRVLAHVSLTAGERRSWYGMRAQPGRRIEWLLGRIAMKDAVRAWALHHHGVDLQPADVEILTTTEGAPYVHCPPLESIGGVPVVSLTHSKSMIVAGAARPGAVLGIDIEASDRDTAAIDRALTDRESEMVESGVTRTIEVLVAKEAAAKAVGTGLGGNIRRWPVMARDPWKHSLIVAGPDDASTLWPVMLLRPPGAVLGICYERRDRT